MCLNFHIMLHGRHTACPSRQSCRKPRASPSSRGATARHELLLELRRVRDSDCREEVMHLALEVVHGGRHLLAVVLLHRCLHLAKVPTAGLGSPPREGSRSSVREGSRRSVTSSSTAARRISPSSYMYMQTEDTARARARVACAWPQRDRSIG